MISGTARRPVQLVGLVYLENKLALRFLFNTSFTVNSDTLNAQEALLFLQTCKSIPATQSANISSTGYLGFLWPSAACNTNEANSGYNHFEHAQPTLVHGRELSGWYRQSGSGWLSGCDHGHQQPFRRRECLLRGRFRPFRQGQHFPSDLVGALKPESE